jgi:parallel beta-helix repeat protein
MKKRNNFIATLIGLLSWLPFFPSWAATYHVATTGNDANPGTALLPWRTVSHAATKVAAGDTVLIHPGIYNGGIVINTSGRAAAPIVFRANGADVIIDGGGGTRDAFFIAAADHVIVEGLLIRRANRAGLRISLSDSVVVRNCTFADNGRWGVFTDFSDFTLIENCETYGAVDEHGIYISNSSDYPTIRNNRIHHNRANGIHINGDLSQGGDGVISHGLVEGNIIYENGVGGGSGINMDGVTDAIVRNNLLYDNNASGISVYQIDGGSGSKNNRLLNNTIIVPADGRWAINIPDTNDTGNKIFNNIIFSSHSFRGSILIPTANLAGFESDYNVVVDRFSIDGGNSTINLAAWKTLGYDTHSFIATPAQLFVNPTTQDYRLKAGSPAIDAGISSPDVLKDLAGISRPVGRAFDIGAYEYNPATAVEREPSNPPTGFALEQNYPNPFNSPTTFIRYRLHHPSRVELSIHTILGQKVRTLVEQDQRAGEFVLRWDGRDDRGVALSNGVYFFRLQTDHSLATKKMLLMR